MRARREARLEFARRTRARSSAATRPRAATACASSSTMKPVTPVARSPRAPSRCGRRSPACRRPSPRSSPGRTAPASRSGTAARAASPRKSSFSSSSISPMNSTCGVLEQRLDARVEVFLVGAVDLGGDLAAACRRRAAMRDGAVEPLSPARCGRGRRDSRRAAAASARSRSAAGRDGTVPTKLACGIGRRCASEIETSGICRESARRTRSSSGRSRRPCSVVSVRRRHVAEQRRTAASRCGNAARRTRAAAARTCRASARYAARGSRDARRGAARCGAASATSLRRGHRVAAREQRHVMALRDQLLGEIGDDALGAAIELRRHASISGAICAIFIRTPVWTISAACPVRMPRSHAIRRHADPLQQVAHHARSVAMASRLR